MGVDNSVSPAEATRRNKEAFERRAAHAKRDAAFRADNGMPANLDPPARKGVFGSAGTKMDAGVTENKGAAVDDGYDAMSRDDLAAAAEEAGLSVTREDGRDDLEPTKADLVRALRGA